MCLYPYSWDRFSCCVHPGSDVYALGFLSLYSPIVLQRAVNVRIYTAV